MLLSSLKLVSFYDDQLSSRKSNFCEGDIHLFDGSHCDLGSS